MIFPIVHDRDVATASVFHHARRLDGRRQACLRLVPSGKASGFCFRTISCICLTAHTLSFSSTTIRGCAHAVIDLAQSWPARLRFSPAHRAPMQSASAPARRLARRQPKQRSAAAKAHRSIAGADIAPAVRAQMRPCRTSANVGMLWAPKRRATSGASSMLSLTGRMRGHQALRRALELGCHGLTGPTPRRPEIDEERYAASIGLAEEARLIEHERLRPEQRAMTVTAFRPHGQLAARNAVERIAVRTGYLLKLRHDPSYHPSPPFIPPPKPSPPT